MASRTHWELEYVPPLDWDFFLRYLSARATPGVEFMEDGRYHRTFSVGGRAGVLTASRHPTLPRLIVESDDAPGEGGDDLVRRARRMFDLDADLAAVYGVLGADARLRPLLDESPGGRIPGAWSAFELLVRTIVGQQVAVKAATTIMGRITERVGVPVETGEGRARCLFPTPEAIARGRLGSIGMPSRRVSRLQNAARFVADRGVPFPDDGQTVADVRKALLALPGIGPWTVEYFSLRALRESDAWPGTDLVLRRTVDAHPGLEPAVEKWKPYRGYAAMHLWNRASQRSMRKGR